MSPEQYLKWIEYWEDKKKDLCLIESKIYYDVGVEHLVYNAKFGLCDYLVYAGCKINNIRETKTKEFKDNVRQAALSYVRIKVEKRNESN